MNHKRKANSETVLDPTSTRNKYVMCECGRKCNGKKQLIIHLKQCDGKWKPIVCNWCNLEFKNRGNLVNHSYFMHGGKGVITKDLQGNKCDVYKCNVCAAIFKERFKLVYHIRRLHFNLKLNIPQYEEKEVNQTWFESVLNTNLVMEIKKTGLNTLLMKPVPPDPDIKTLKANQIDLSPLYPTGRKSKTARCKICNKLITKNVMKKHMDERHYQNYKLQCNNCNKMFKRVYLYLKHNCSAKPRRKRRPKVPKVYMKPYSAVQITGITSLKTIEVE